MPRRFLPDCQPDFTGLCGKDIINEIYNIIPEIIKYERPGARNYWLTRPSIMEDRIWRAYAPRAMPHPSPPEIAGFSVIGSGLRSGYQGYGYKNTNEISSFPNRPISRRWRRKRSMPAAGCAGPSISEKTGGIVLKILDLIKSIA